MIVLKDEVLRVVTQALHGDGNRTVLVGVSGGLDSVVLLHLMTSFAPSLGVNVEVAHFNHGLRGAESDADETFVRRLAKRWGLAVHLGRMVVDGASPGESVEMAARRLRHKFLSEKAIERGIGHVVLGHHADDQLETIFLRLFRGEGSSFGGIRAVAPSPADRRITLIRPLLRIRRDKLEAWAKEHSLNFRTDSSNADEKHLRNRVRHRLIPLIMRQFGPSALDGVLRSTEVTGVEGDWIESQAQEWLKNPQSRPFAVLPTALQRRIIRAQLIDLDVETSFPRIEWLRENCGRSLSVGASLSLTLESSGILRRAEEAVSLRMNPDEKQVRVTGSPRELDWSGVTIQLRRKLVPKDRRRLKVGQEPGRECFDADAIGGLITIRHWRSGDRFQPIGMKSAAKLQDLFVSAKIPAKARRQLVVAEAAGKGIFWVEGLRIAEGFKLQSTSVRYLEWRWNRRDAFLAAVAGTC